MNETSLAAGLDRVSTPEVFRRRALQWPDRVIFEETEGRAITFGQFHAEAQKWAGALIRAGVQPGDRVASMFPNSIEMMLLWIGLGWTQGWDVAVNTAYRGDILKYVIGNAEPKLIFIEAPYLEAFVAVANDLPSIETVVVWGGDLPTGLKARVISLEAFLDGALVPEGLTAPGIGDTQGIVYTSGTTGVSKGALISWGRHGGGPSCQMFKLFLDENDVWYSDFPACHNSAKIPLRIGGQIGVKSVIARVFKTDRFWTDVKQFGCTATLLLPNMANWLVKAEGTGDDHGHKLKQVVGYGPDLGPFGRRFGSKVHVNYGNTEAGNTLYHLDVGDAANGYSGRAYPPFYARIVDENDFEVNLGETGQLITRCDEPWMVFQNYYKLPSATYATLRNGWYHTADLFRMDETGGVFFVDRHADYIRRRGENISSQEVEKVVLEHPAIHEAACIGVKSPDGEDEVKICIALREGASVEPAALIEFLSPRLATFMVPRYVQFYAELPKTPATHRVRKAELRQDTINAETWDAGTSRSRKASKKIGRHEEIKMSKEITLVGVGDLLIRDTNPDYLFDSTREVFQSADIRFGNCEQPYAWKYPEMAKVFKKNCGFEVMNFANNHILDHGAEVFLNTIGQLRAEGIQVIGAGANIAEARTPAIVEKDGVKIAFLGYNSIQVPSYQATGARAGCAPLKAHTAYQQLFEEAPGTPARIRTFADDDDLAALLNDVKAAKDKADIVVVSLHWGPLLKSSHISDYQPVVAHAVIDAGADLILGHHPHTCKGVEVYKGKVIFYSINHFIMKNEKPVTLSYASHGYVTNSHIHDMLETFPGEFGLYAETPLYPFGPETLNTMIVKAKIVDKAITQVSILPCRIGNDYQPALLRNGFPAFDVAVAQIRDYSAAAGLAATFTVQGDELLVTA